MMHAHETQIRKSRLPASESEIVALYTEASPLRAEFPYHAFSKCPPTALFGKPAFWPGPDGDVTTARLLWHDEALYVCWELEGQAAAPIEAAKVQEACLLGLEDGAVKPDQKTVLLDERVECFLWQPPIGKEAFQSTKEAEKSHNGQTYYAFEINYDGKALTNKASFGGHFDYSWDGDSAYSVWTKEIPVGWGSSSSPVPTASGNGMQPFKRVVVAEFRWASMGIKVGRDLRIGLHRAQHSTCLPSTDLMGQAEVDALLKGMIWTSWVDPNDSEVNFHRPELFGKLVLAPSHSKIDFSCSAARLFKSKSLRVLFSPLPSIDECPSGSILVRARYASLCGSDLPYFRDSESKSASSYWDRDGFCGHEVIGIVLASKSDRFQIGDAVLSLPSSYFKAHAGSKQEWYQESVHEILLENFPVRGGFSQVYTSHELYSYKIKECVPRMLAAQGLGTVLRMAKRIGSVLGKTVVILGLGQNGLLATRLMSQFCAKQVIGVDPLEYRRNLALTQFGANQAVDPSEAPGVIAAATGGRGADVVLEMVGHNQSTINDALEYAACAGIVAAFGVPDDRIYNTFEFTLFFRKNITMISSVIPDPGTDFPDAVALIEEGRFSTEGIFSHVMPLRDIQKAFEMASNYTDEVVKLVVDLS
eukprot:TRINITY_DN34246_c0_g1_i1.p1 TRINITY_DN34246_c0_g1~~TRINITY_DN34246_c0_g1_i1.p1  ORF type:complete len:646 (-),score=114.32 TRINITY_DN34246_c0_g1_i1:155-2092(-)